MNKKIFSFVWAALSLAVLASCVEDKGNYDYTTPTPLYVDTVGLSGQMSITMLQYDRISITPKLVFVGDASTLEHSWAIYRRIDGDYAPPGVDGNPPIDLENSTGVLQTVITQPPGTYYVEYSAYDPLSGRTALMRWPVTVEGILGSGWLVYHQGDGTADCDLIKTSLLVGSNNEEKVLRNIYSQTNPDRPITAAPLAVAARSGTHAWVTLLWDGGGARLSTDDMSTMLDYSQLFYTTPAVFKPQGYLGASTEIVVNDGGVHINDVGWAVGTPLFADPVAGEGLDYYAAPYTALTYGGNRTFYDNLNMRFMYSGSYTGRANVPVPTITIPFDISNIGKKMVYMAQGYGNNNFYAVFAEPVDDGRRYIYVTSFSNSSVGSSVPVGIMDVSDAPEIASASAFAFGKRGPVAFYAAGNKIYQIRYTADGGVALQGVENVRTFGSGQTITCMKFMEHQGIELDERADDKYLFVATWDAAASAGRVYVLQVDVSNGTISAEPAAEYTGFGRVADMTFKPV